MGDNSKHVDFLCCHFIIPSKLLLHIIYTIYTCQNTSLPDVLFGWSPFHYKMTLLSTSRKHMAFHLQFIYQKKFHFHMQKSTSFHILQDPCPSSIGYQPDRHPFTWTFWYSRSGDGCNSRSSKCHSLIESSVTRDGLGCKPFHRLENCFGLTRYSRPTSTSLFFIVWWLRRWFFLIIWHFTLMRFVTC